MSVCIGTSLTEVEHNRTDAYVRTSLKYVRPEHECLFVNALSSNFAFRREKKQVLSKTEFCFVNLWSEMQIFTVPVFFPSGSVSWCLMDTFLANNLSAKGKLMYKLVCKLVYKLSTVRLQPVPLSPIPASP